MLANHRNKLFPEPIFERRVVSIECSDLIRNEDTSFGLFMGLQSSQTQAMHSEVITENRTLLST